MHINMLMTNERPLQCIIFGLTVRLIWQEKKSSPIVQNDRLIHECYPNQFHLNIPGVAHFLALPEENCILIEKAKRGIPTQVFNTWLFGTVMAYMLQYHGYLVLHGSAVLINEHAVIFSGQSGAGKSTLASAFTQNGYLFITDDLVVIKQNHKGQYCIVPGPAKLKLWKDAMQHFNHDMTTASPVNLKTDKYALHVDHCCSEPMIPISAFYELNINQEATSYYCDRLNTTQALKTLLQNAYRHFMLKPLGKLESFFHDCRALSQQITVHQLTRTPHFHELPEIIQHIELN